jgi:hypothetical protein
MHTILILSRALVMITAVIAGAAIATGCILLGSGDVDRAAVPFQFGTNAVVRIDQRLNQSGLYIVHLQLSRTYQHLGSEAWPTNVAADLWVSVTAGGQTVTNREVRKLVLGTYGGRYILEHFRLYAPATVSVRIEDRSAGGSSPATAYLTYIRG